VIGVIILTTLLTPPFLRLAISSAPKPSEITDQSPAEINEQEAA
jgi:hypothetical protein